DADVMGRVRSLILLASVLTPALSVDIRTLSLAGNIPSTAAPALSSAVVLLVLLMRLADARRLFKTLWSTRGDGPKLVAGRTLISIEANCWAVAAMATAVSARVPVTPVAAAVDGRDVSEATVASRFCDLIGRGDTVMLALPLSATASSSPDIIFSSADMIIVRSRSEIRVSEVISSYKPLLVVLVVRIPSLDDFDGVPADPAGLFDAVATGLAEIFRLWLSGAKPTAVRLLRVGSSAGDGAGGEHEPA
ncbi:hypothetical protein H4R22_005452, partial [Coemansia sp. RSA 1290]